MSVPIIDAEVVLECGNNLGEGKFRPASVRSSLGRALTDLVSGILWDSNAKLVRWIDIDEATVHAWVSVMYDARLSLF